MIPARGSHDLPGAPVRTPDETLLGIVGAVVGEDGSGGVVWASVVMGADRSEGRVVVPLANAVTEDDTVRLPFGEETVLRAPRPAAAESMTSHELTELESWYGAFTRADSAQGWVAPQDLPDVPFILDEGQGTH